MNEGDPEFTRSTWIEKETGNTTANPRNLFVAADTDSHWRELWARTTVLNLNLRNIQDYLRIRTLEQATKDFPFTFSPTPTMPNETGASAGLLLRENFSGLIYAARTNRYPWNPYLPGATGANPWNEQLPND